jgi:hypothetical protein
MPKVAGERRQPDVEPITIGSERDLRDGVTHHNAATPTNAHFVSEQTRSDGTPLEPFLLAC